MNQEEANVEQGLAECRVRVNGEVVTLVGEQHAPAGIKRAAIEQGVEIKEDFVLSIEYEPRKTRIVAVDEVVVVEEDTCFVAVADDDNS